MMPTRRPLVSVVIPAYNSEGTLTRALESVLRQDYRPLDVIVVDDASRDGTRRVAESHTGQGVRVIGHDRNQGVSGARNTGIGVAAGELIAFLDADDEWLAGKLGLQVAELLDNPGLSLVACDAVQVDADGVVAGSVYPDRPPATGPDAWRVLLAYNFIATPCVVTRRRDLLELGGFDRTLPIGEDQDMWIRLALRGEVGYVAQTLVRVHTVAGSLSDTDATQSLRHTLPMIYRHLGANRHRLSHRDTRMILGERLSRIGRYAYGRSDFRTGLRCIGHALLLGYKPLETLAYLVRAAPPTQWLKRRLQATAPGLISVAPRQS